MAKELNNEFDVQARVQKAFAESVAEKVRLHQGLNDKEIEHLCPVAFKSTMSKAEIKKLGLSKHYSNQLMVIKSICLHLNILTTK
jgi:hypothetical protein